MDIDHDTSNNDDNNNDIYLFYEVMIILVDMMIKHEREMTLPIAM